MSKKQVTVNLSFDVTFVVDAESNEEAEQIAEGMQLYEFLEWAGCASFDMNVLNVEDE